MTDLFKEIMPLNRALDLLNQQFTQVKSNTETVAVEEALGRFLAKEIKAPCDLPGFNRSTVDGFALRSQDTHGASEAKPAWLEVVGEVKMGEIPDFTLEPGQAAIIPTGGALPVGADSVVMVEYTMQEIEEEVEVLKPSAMGDNIIIAQADAGQGNVVFSPPLRLRPEHIGLLCGLGIQEVEVVSPLRAAVFSTGDEVVAPTSQLKPGQVRDINGPMLVASLKRDGCQASYCGILPDELEQVQQALARALEDNDLILISGGSSVGQRDHTATAIDSLGRPGVLVHGIGIKPGKPTIMGVVQGRPILGMPGNPTSAQVVYSIIVRALLHRLQTGQDPKPPATISARFSRSMQGSSGRAEFVRVRLEEGDDGLVATPVLGESGLIITLAGAHGLVALPQDVKGIEAGTMVEVLPLD